MSTTPVPPTAPSHRVAGRPRRGRTIALVVLGLVLAHVLAGLGWTAWQQRPLGSPQATELKQARISDTLASATVLGVGEATHGTHEFRAVWQWAVEQLADRGFTTVAFEEDAGAVSQVNAWVQGGPGTAEEAAERFGFRLNRTREMADLLSWIRTHNEGRPEADRIQLHGIDFQRPEIDKAVVLDWLADVDADAAARHEQALAGLTDDSHYDPDASAQLRAAADALRADMEAATAGRTDDASVRALLAARALARGTERGAAGLASHIRDQLMADQLADTVDLRAAQGGEHTLLFAHNGHVDATPTESFALGAALGLRAKQRWGDDYRVIGTAARRVALTDGGEHYSFTVNSPLRGLFAGARIGYLEFADAMPENRSVLAMAQPIASAGSPFQAIQAWVPFFHEVPTTPELAFDALVHADETTGVTPLP